MSRAEVGACLSVVAAAAAGVGFAEESVPCTVAAAGLLAVSLYLIVTDRAR